MTNPDQKRQTSTDRNSGSDSEIDHVSHRTVTAGAFAVAAATVLPSAGALAEPEPSTAETRTIGMNKEITVVKRMYERFNARDIDGVLAVLADDVVWANGMDGGYVHGREAVRQYWTRQLASVSPLAEPVSFAEATDGSIVVEVQQSVRDLDGKPLDDQTHGLMDKTVGHIFRFRDGKVARFEIRD